METPVTSSVNTKKSRTSVLFTLEGLDLNLMQEKQVNKVKHIY